MALPACRWRKCDGLNPERQREDSLRAPVGDGLDLEGAAELAEEMDDKYFKRVVFSSESTPFKWLTSFADLHDLIGAK